MNAEHLLGVWAILSICWVTIYVAAYALPGEHLEFARVVSDVMSPIAATLMIGWAAVAIFRGLRKTK